jgi:hypothetical protein
VSEQPDPQKPVKPESAAAQGASNQDFIAIYDPDLDLGVQLRAADAKSWGRDQTVLKEISSHAALPGAGKGGISGEPGSANAGKNYGAASNSGDNSGMHSSGTSSTTGVDTNTGQGTRHSGSAGIDSTSASEHKQ